MSTKTANAPQDDQDNPGGTTPPEDSGKPAEEHTGPPATTEETPETEPETFPRAYVEELRTENAKHRTNSKRADSLTAALVASYVDASGRLHDPSDLPVTEELLGEDGLPDREKIKSAVESLIESKPHLARIRPVGDVGQGHQTGEAPTGLAAFGSMMRDAAR